MAANPKIIPPRIPFLDPRTGMIAREWFHWLLAGRKDLDDAALMAMLSSFDAQASAAQARETALEATLLASLPAPQHDFAPEIEAVRLERIAAAVDETDKRIDDLNLRFSMPSAPSVSDHGDLTGLADNDHPQYLLVADIDDTPVNGEVAQPISSNWAFDHVAAADPHTGYRLESADHNHQSTGAQAGQLDHGLALTGLTDDDHGQYWNAARGAARVSLRI